MAYLARCTSAASVQAAVDVNGEVDVLSLHLPNAHGALQKPSASTERFHLSAASLLAKRPAPASNRSRLRACTGPHVTTWGEHRPTWHGKSCGLYDTDLQTVPGQANGGRRS